jgi:hypothetical protein
MCKWLRGRSSPTPLLCVPHWHTSSLVYVSQEIRGIETTEACLGVHDFPEGRWHYPTLFTAWPHRYAGVRRRKATRSGRIRYSTRCRKRGVFSVGARGVIGGVRAGSGAVNLADRGGVPWLTGERYDQYPVPRHERACASRVAATGRNRKAGAYHAHPQVNLILRPR